MLNNRTGIIICARVKSSRLKDKVLQRINGRHTIEILLDKVINDDIPTVLAIPRSEENNILEDIATEKGVEVYRGQDDSPLHRLYECAKKFNFEHVVRITADDILIDLHLLQLQVRFHVNGRQDYTYMKRCPEGIAGEVIRVSALERVVEEVGEKPVEFISYYLKKGNFRIIEFYPPREYQVSFRLTMDYEEDLVLLKTIFSYLAEPFGTLDIINFLKKHKQLLNINKLPFVTLYTCNYNTEPYIIDCVESIFRQSFYDFEYILLDDYSTDSSLNTIAEYYTNMSYGEQKKMKVLRNSENLGLPASCNKALSYARGRFIMRVDSDDMLKDRALDRLVDEIKLHNTGGVLAGYTKIDEKGERLQDCTKMEWHPGCALLSTWYCNEVKFREGLEYLEGDEFYSRFNQLYEIAYVPESLWYYRQREGQKTSSKKHPKNIENK